MENNINIEEKKPLNAKIKAKFQEIKIKNSKMKLNYFGLRLKELFLQKTILFGFLFLIIVNLSFGIIYSSNAFYGLNQVTITEVYSFWLIAFSLINFVLIGFTIWKLFHMDETDGQVQLELRNGFSKRLMYSYRLMLTLGLICLILFIELGINGIGYLVNQHKDAYYAYRIFISPFFWLIFISLFSLMLNLFFVVIIKTKMAIALSLILSLICLFSASLGAHWTAIKTAKDTVPNVVNKKNPTSYQSGGGLYRYVLTSEKYVSLGVEYQNQFTLFQTLKVYKEYDFLELGAIEKIKDPNEGNKYLFYRELVQIGEQFKNEETKAINALKQSTDSLLQNYGSFLRWTWPIGAMAVSQGENWLLAKFFEDATKSLDIFQNGFALGEAYGYLVKWQDFNKKLTQAKRFNPLYQINLLFFGFHKDYSLDNFINFNRPLFAQGLNIKYSFDLIRINPTFDEEKYVLQEFKTSQNLNPIWVLVGYSLGMIVIIGLIYFGYKVKK